VLALNDNTAAADPSATDLMNFYLQGKELIMDAQDPGIYDFYVIGAGIDNQLLPNEPVDQDSVFDTQAVQLTNFPCKTSINPFDAPTRASMTSALTSASDYFQTNAVTGTQYLLNHDNVNPFDILSETTIVQIPVFTNDFPDLCPIEQHYLFNDFEENFLDTELYWTERFLDPGFSDGKLTDISVDNTGLYLHLAVPLTPETRFQNQTYTFKLIAFTRALASGDINSQTTNMITVQKNALCQSLLANMNGTINKANPPVKQTLRFWIDDYVNGETEIQYPVA
jgi:hypothetical protein